MKGETILATIPPPSAPFHVYARGHVEGMTAYKATGDTGIILRGVAAVFYTYKHHRRAYLIRRTDELKYTPPVTLPNIDTEVGVIYFARGRRIDVLRNVLWELEQLHGDAVYGFSTLFWQKIGCLIDAMQGLKSGARLSNLLQIGA